MSRPLLILSIALAALAATPPDRTTADGVYTAAQANAGTAVFTEACAACHVAGWHETVKFYAKWHGRSLGELYGYIAREMPQTDPGTLTPQEYADVTAYLLRLTGMPAGRASIAPDAGALAGIRIDTVPSLPR